jgi:predicted transcriptional regulator
MNKEAQEAIKAKKFPLEKLRSIAIVNMAATAIPNFILSNRIAKSQSEYPTTVYVKDLNKALVKSWDLADNSSNLVIIGADGLVKYVYKGKLPSEEISKMLSVIEKEVAETH